MHSEHPHKPFPAFLLPWPADSEHIRALPAGTVPAGYNVRPHFLPDSGFPAAESGSVDNIIQIVNHPGAALPSTGGPGTNLIYLFGAMIISLAVTGLVMKRRK